MPDYPRLISVKFSSDDNASIRFSGTCGERNEPFLFGVSPLQISTVAATGWILVVGVKGRATAEIFTCASQEDAHKFAEAILDHVDGVVGDF